MKLRIKKKQINVNYSIFIKRLGYGIIRDRHSGSESFVRRLGREFYPRFHMYVNDFKDMIELNIHIDHKKIGISTNNRHNAEYSGELVSREIKRIKDALGNFSDDVALKNTKENHKKKSFLRRIFK